MPDPQRDHKKYRGAIGTSRTNTVFANTKRDTYAFMRLQVVARIQTRRANEASEERSGERRYGTISIPVAAMAVHRMHGARVRCDRRRCASGTNAA